jgi:endonuclease/exonuclease/phosphatase family metal-dependent hydrolase
MGRVLVTWNVAGLSEPALDERTEAQCLFLLLSEPTPHVIALQEVVRRTWFAHWRPHLSAAGFRVFPADPTDTDSEYFTVLAVRDASATGGLGPFAPSRMGRRLVVVESGGWTFCTAHFESERAGREHRVAQASAVAALLHRSPGPAVFAGDTNLRAEEEPRVEGLAALTDAWDGAGRPASGRATWRGARASARYDRIWCNPRVDVGTCDVLAGGAAWSDHVPVRATLVPPS